MAAGVNICIWCSTATTGHSSGETAGFTFNRSALRSGTSEAIPIPTSTGTAFSYPKYICIEVVSSDATTIDNRQVRMSSQPPAGLILWYDTSGLIAAYSTPAAAIGAATTSGDSNNPAGGTTNWTQMTTTYTAWSTAASTGGAEGISGAYLVLGLGVGSTGTYTGGPGTAIVLPDISIQYDEY